MMIVPEKMEQAVQREDPQLDMEGVPVGACLPRRDARRNRDVAQISPAPGPRRRSAFCQIGKGQDVRRPIHAAEFPVDRAHSPIAHKGDRHDPGRAAGRGVPQAALESARSDRTSRAVRDMDRKLRPLSQRREAVW
jgi:hypothetical protein